MPSDRIYYEVMSSKEEVKLIENQLIVESNVVNSKGKEDEEVSHLDVIVVTSPA